MQVKRLLTLVMVFSILFFNNVFANIPNHTEAFYVNDFAGVLSSETMAHIVERNLHLSELNGAQIVVTTVHFVDGIPIEDYAMEMFNQWGIGDAVQNNGVLLLLAIGQEDFYVAIGDGLHNIMPDGDVSIMLTTYLEPYFDVSNYDQGVRNVFDQIYSVLSRHNISSPLVNNIADTNTATDNITTTNNTFSLENLIFLILFIAMIFYVPRMSNGRRGMRRSRRRGVPLWVKTSWLNSASSRRRNSNQNRPQEPFGGSFANRSGGGGRTSGGGVGRTSGNSRFGGGSGTRLGGSSRLGNGSASGSRLGGGGRTSGGGVGRKRK